TKFLPLMLLDEGENGNASFPWAQSGQFSTRDKHLCSWQLISGERDTELQITCHPAEGEPQRCIYRGQPELCAAYSAKGRQFWKQILGKLRRKHHPCQDTSPLKSRLCSSKKETPEAQLHVTQGSPKGKSHAAPTRPALRQPTIAVVEGTVRPTELNADVVDAYCEEKWHSLCHFFVNFWNG
uniref:Fibroblast growth factor binding protein 3 n=1 Tax=Naja naja TaxID=35670 RepID=A0A8C6XI81_NAJNA